MEKIIRKWTAAWVAIAFTWMAMGIISPSQLKAGTIKTEGTVSTVETAKNENSGTNSFEKEGITPEIAKKKKFPWPLIVAGAFVVGIVVYFTLIKKTKHILIVEAGTGVTGTPAAGRYVYKKGEKIEYNFICTNEYKNLRVFLDEKMAAASGTIIMDKAHSIRAEATRFVDYYLTINTDDGITGFPPRGTRLYREGTTVAYHYAFSDLSLIAKLDGNPVLVLGSLVMDKDHILEVTFGPQDIQGKWHFQLKEKRAQIKHELNILFSGEKASGVFKILKDANNSYWSDWWGKTGTYEVSVNGVTMVIDRIWEEEYSFVGNFISKKSISGNYRHIIFGDLYDRLADEGAWTATRIE
jgi:hypothetical protein